ncbi:MAG: hypothetical protein AseanaTS_02420 [Candidatus Pelagadaptatus aseana]
MYKKMEFSEYKSLVSSKLDVDFNPESAYKLCDIKPAYGLLHYEEIEEFDFWGFCDIDLIFGDIRSFMTDEVLSRFDFVSAFGRRVSGHFFLVRNNVENNSVFKKCADWKVAFEDVEHHCFDEKSFSDLFIKFKNHPDWSKRLLSKIFLPLSRRSLFKERYSTPGLRYDWVDGSRNFPTEWYWNSGVLTNNAASENFLYFHFLKWKREWAGEAHVDPLVSQSWRIDSAGFHCL